MKLRFKNLSCKHVTFFPVTIFSFIAIMTANIQAQAFRPPLNKARRAPVTVVLTSGTSWTVPSGVSSLISVECWGGGGGTASHFGTSYGGGGGGAYAKKLSVPVTSGASISYSIGSGGTSLANVVGTNGGDTWFVNSTTVLAKGGQGSIKDNTNYLGGAGGSSAASIGNVVYAGGNGGNSVVDMSGAGGGSSATPTGAGTNGANSNSTTGGAGGSAATGGAGGTAGVKSTTPTMGGDGVANQNGGGGGGGGGGSTSGTGPGAVGGAGGFPGGGAGSQGGNWDGEATISKNGAAGQIIIVYKP
ncbi:hypothetical protein D3C87_1242950 [compost metagenome]